jgi:selenocysteine lyase/cysteine desulfurase
MQFLLFPKTFLAVNKIYFNNAATTQMQKEVIGKK